MLMIKTFGNEIDCQEVKPEYEKQFLRHGWIQAPAGFSPKGQTLKTEKLQGKVISEEDYELLMKMKEGKIQISDNETQIEETEVVKNKGGRPKKL